MDKMYHYFVQNFGCESTLNFLSIGKCISEKKCGTPHLDTEMIKQKFLLAYNQLMKNHDGHKP